MLSAVPRKAVKSNHSLTHLDQCTLQHIWYALVHGNCNCCGHKYAPAHQQPSRWLDNEHKCYTTVPKQTIFQGGMCQVMSSPQVSHLLAELSPHSGDVLFWEWVLGVTLERLCVTPLRAKVTAGELHTQWAIRFKPDARLTDGISIEFENRSKIAVPVFKMFSTDYSEILQTLQKCYRRDLWKI